MQLYVDSIIALQTRARHASGDQSITLPLGAYQQLPHFLPFLPLSTLLSLSPSLSLSHPPLPNLFCVFSLGKLCVVTERK